MIEEPEEIEEEKTNPILEPYISSKEYIMAREGEGEGEVHNVNDEKLRIGGGGPRIGGGGGGRGDRGEPDLVGFPILDEDTTTKMKYLTLYPS